MPAYLSLCMDTWYKFIPNLKLQIINHDNWGEYVGRIYDLDKLKTFSLAMQSDAVTAAVLSELGGVFFDIDTVVTSSDILSLLELAPKSLVHFGQPNHRAGHLAVMKCDTPNNPIINAWKDTCKARILNKPEKIDWSYLGNGILTPLERDNKYFDDYLMIDRKAYGAILEVVIENAVFRPTSNTINDYVNLFFNENISLDVEQTLKYVKCGLFMLHNSWTPKEYKQIIDKEEFLNTRCFLANVFRYLLK